MMQLRHGTDGFGEIGRNIRRHRDEGARAALGHVWGGGTLSMILRLRPGHPLVKDHVNRMVIAWGENSSSD